MDQKIPSNVCKLKGCKAKLLVPMNCNACGLSYCVKHRLEQDHQCVGKKSNNNYSSSSQSTAQKMSAMAAIKRSAGLKQSTSTNNNKSGNNNSNNGNR